jgi:psiF repeat
MTRSWRSTAAATGRTDYDPTDESSGERLMNKLLVLMMAGTMAAALGVAAPAVAADTAAAPAAPAMNSQQDKMKACNTEATGKTGDDRKAFMKTCLSAKPAPAAKPESKMGMCNKQTAGMSGDARAKAQSECMKAPAKAP